MFCRTDPPSECRQGKTFLQLWGFCDRFGITNRLLRIIIGTGFSVADLLCYAVGTVPCYVAEYSSKVKRNRAKEMS
ncbi:MAG: DUF2809 domain-containing protein [Lachnospiraceae bacterium]|nr:DUF2809 domain-containing protein [Lachnospiraceae bacterium]